MSAIFPKQCSCCPRLLTRSDWAALEPVGFHEDEVERLELRNCSCGSTLAILTAPDERSILPRTSSFYVHSVTYSNKSDFKESDWKDELEKGQKLLKIKVLG